jgi:membrane fusion protein, multidrug efflux system
MRKLLARSTSIVLSLCLLVAVGCKNEDNSRSGKPVSSPYVVEVVTVKTQPFRETLFATGTLRARESVVLQAERAGAVKEVRFEEARPVKAGEVLVVIDDSELQAQLTSAKAQLELASATEKRDRELLKTNKLISQAAYDQSVANLHIAQAAVQLIEAQLKKAQIVAPFDGIAGLRQVSEGAYLTPGSPIGSFQDISALKLDFTLPERYLPNLRNAKTVNLRVAGSSEPIEGEIYAIEPTIDVATRSLKVRAIVPNEEQLLLPGAFAEVEVMLGEIPDAILIPPISLIPGLKEQKVFLYKNGRVEERDVELGLRTVDRVQIVKGLQPGDKLITSGILQLRPGMEVETRPASEPAQGQDSPTN